MVNVAFYF